MRLETGGWLVIADGARFLVFENAGTPVHPDLRIRAVRRRATPRTGESGSDRPGRYPASGGRRETVENTDWHRIDKTRFARTVAETLAEAAAANCFPALVLVADPRTLGALRPLLSPAVRARLAHEIAADWSHLDVPAIERHLAAAGESADRV